MQTFPIIYVIVGGLISIGITACFCLFVNQLCEITEIDKPNQY